MHDNNRLPHVNHSTRRTTVPTSKAYKHQLEYQYAGANNSEQKIVSFDLPHMITVLDDLQLGLGVDRLLPATIYLCSFPAGNPQNCMQCRIDKECCEIEKKIDRKRREKEQMLHFVGGRA